MNKLLSRQNFITGIAVVLSAALFIILFSKLGISGAIIFAALVLTFTLAILVFRNPEFGWSLIIFFLPFERVPTINLGGVDIKINTLLGFMTLFAWVLALMFNPKKYKVQNYAIAIPIVLFISAMLISLTQAQNMSRALEVLVFILFTIALSILAVNMVKEKTDLKKTILVLFLSTFLVSIFGLFYQFGGNLLGLSEKAALLKEGYGAQMMGFPRIMAFSQEPLYFANFLLIPLSLALAFFFNKINLFEKTKITDKKSWWYLLIFIVLMLLVLVLTVSRGAYLGLLASFLVLAIYLFRRIFTLKNIATFIICAGVIFYGVAFGLSHGDPQATNNFITHVLVRDYAKSASVQERLMTYKAALDIYREYPLLGVGMGNYGPWLAYYPPQPPAGGWLVVNNEFLEVLAETGLVGAVCFVLLLIVLIYRSILAIKYADDLFLKTVMIGLFAAFIGVLVQYNFFSTLYIIHIWVLIGLLVANQTLIFRSRRV